MLKNFGKFFVIFLVIFAWIFSGWPRIWQKPPIPPEVQEAWAADTREFIVDTASTTWVVPNDWNYASNTIEVIGGGGGSENVCSTHGCGAGGGGAYASTSNVKGLSGNIDIAVGTGGIADTNGGNTWFGAATCAAAKVCAEGGKLGSGNTGGAGGTVLAGAGSSGGAGGTSAGGTDGGGGGGGGAAGPGGAGRDGGDPGGDGGGGGGGSGGSSSTAGGNGDGVDAGGAGGQGPGGTGGGTVPGGNGSAGGGGGGGSDLSTEPGGTGGSATQWTTVGTGGGGGGGADAGAGGNGAIYGGGGGAPGEDGTVAGVGKQGIIVITYTPATVPGAPINLATTTVGDARVDLSWASSTDGGSLILYYNIYRNTASPATTFLASTTNATSSDTSVVNGTTYFYRVTAKNAVGESDYSNEVSATPQAAATVSCSTNISTTDFGPLSASEISTSSPNASTTMSCTYAGGCSMWVQDAGDGTNPGLATTSPPYLIPSNTATLSIGNEGYGIQAATNTAGLTLSGIYAKSGNDVGGLSRTATRLASSSEAVTGKEVLITHKAAISATTPSGKYTDTIIYNCAAN